MSAASDPVLQELLDKAEISDVITRYALGIDRHDFDLAASCYATDAQADFYGVVSKGVDAIVKGLRLLEQLDNTMHFLGNQMIDLHGDTAGVETYATAYYRAVMPDRQIDMIKGLRYLDGMARKDGRWVVQSQVVVEHWSRNDPVLPLSTPPAGRKPGPKPPVWPKDAGLDYLIDRAAIRDLLARYYSTSDHPDYDGMAATYTPDAEVWYREDLCVGIEAIRKKVSLLDNAITSTHFMGNHLVDIQGDTAASETYVIEYIRAGPVGEETDLVSGLRYLDQMVRRDGKWLTSARTVTSDWGRRDPVTPAPT